MKKRKILFLSLITLAALAYGLNRSGLLVAHLRGTLEEGLTQATGRPVRLGALYGGLTGSLTFLEVEVGASALRQPGTWDSELSAERLDLRLSLWSLLKGQGVVASLREARLGGLKARLLAPQGEAAAVSESAAAKPSLRALRLAVKALPPLALETSVRDGKVTLRRGEGAEVTLVEGVDLRVWPREEGGLRVQASAKAGTGRFALDGWTEADLGQGQLEARLERMSLPWLETRVRPGRRAHASSGLVSGKASLKVAPPREGQWIEGLDLKAELAVKEARLESLWKGLDAEAASADLVLEEGALHLRSIVASSAGGKLTGEADVEQGLGTVRAKVRLAGVDLARLTEALEAPASLGAEGRADLAVEAEGAWEALTVTTQATVQSGRFAGQAVQEALLKFRYTPGQLELSSWEAGIEGGRLHASGSLRRGTRASWGAAALSGQARFERLPLALAAEPVGLTPASGIFDASVDLSGSLDSPGLKMQAAAGDAVLRGLPVLGLKAEASAKGGSITAKAGAKVDGQAWSLKAEMGLGRTHLKLKHIDLEQGRLRVARASGSVDRLSHTARIQLSLGPLELGRLPRLKEWEHLKGQVSGEGLFERAAGAWRGEASLAAPGLSADGHPFPLRAQASFKDGAWTWSAAQQLQSSGLKAHGRWDDASWESAAELNGADAAALGAVLRSPRRLAGQLSGTVKARQEPGAAGPDLWFALAAQDLALDGRKARTAELRGRRVAGDWELERAAAEQAGGGRLGGSASLRAKGESKAHLEAEGWDLGGRKAWGLLDLSGQGRGDEEGLALRLQGRGLKAGEQALPDLRASLSYRQGLLKVSDGAWGEGLAFWGQARKEGPLELRLKASAWDGAPLVRALHGKDLALPFRLSGQAGFKALSPTGGLDGLDFDLAGLGKPGPGSAKGAFKREEGHWSGGASLVEVDADGLERAWLALGQGSSEVPSELRGALNAELRLPPGGRPLELSLTAKGFWASGEELGLVQAALAADAKGGKLAYLRTRAGAKRLDLSGWTWKSPEQGPVTAEGGIRGEGYPIIGGLVELAAQGRLQLSSSKEGWNGRSRVEVLRVNERVYKDLDLGLKLRGRTVSFAIPADKPDFHTSLTFPDKGFGLDAMEARLGKGKASVKGSIDEQGKVDFQGSAAGFPAGELTKILGWTQDWTGTAYGSLLVSGSKDRPLTTVSVKIEDGSVNGFLFDLGTARVQAQDGWVDLAPLGQVLRVTRKGAYSAEVRGRIPTAREDGSRPDMDVQADFPFADLAMMNFLEGVRSGKGPVKLKLRLHGDPSDPEYEGVAETSGGELEPAWMLPPLKDLRLAFSFEGRQARLLSGQARVGEGGPLLKLELADPEKAAWVFSRFVPSRFNLKIRSSRSGWELRNSPELEFLHGLVHADLVLGGDWDEPRVSGSVEMEKGVVTWPPKYAKPGPEPPDPASLSQRIHLELAVRSRAEVQIRTESALAYVDTGEKGLYIRGTGKDRQVEGRINVHRGTVDLLVTEADIASDKDSHIDFQGRRDPFVDLWAVKKVEDAHVAGEAYSRDVDVMIHAFGELGKVQMLLSSPDSGLNQTQLTSLLGLGTTDVTDTRTQGAVSSILGRLPAAALTRLARRTGLVDSVNVKLPVVESAFSSSTGTAQSLSPKAKTLVEVKVGKNLSEKVRVGVTGRQVETEERGARGEAVTGQKQVYSAEVQYQLNSRSRISGEVRNQADGESESRVVVETHRQLDNYDPRRRRQLLEARVSPTPSPAP